MWYYGLIVFKEHYNKYEISFEFNRYELKVPEILFDFMEIKGKENAFILCGWEHAYIINDKKIINKITFDEFDLKNILNNNYICQFKDNLFATLWYQLRNKTSNYDSDNVEYLDNKVGAQIKFCF